MKKEDKTNKRQQMYITPEKRQQIIDDLRYYIKNGISKNYKPARCKIW